MGAVSHDDERARREGQEEKGNSGVQLPQCQHSIRTSSSPRPYRAQRDLGFPRSPRPPPWLPRRSKSLNFEQRRRAEHAATLSLRGRSRPRRLGRAQDRTDADDESNSGHRPIRTQRRARIDRRDGRPHHVWRKVHTLSTFPCDRLWERDRGVDGRDGLAAKSVGSYTYGRHDSSSSSTATRMVNHVMRGWTCTEANRQPTIEQVRYARGRLSCFSQCPVVLRLDPPVRVAIEVVRLLVGDGRVVIEVEAVLVAELL